jgi:hypothetical protein
LASVFVRLRRDESARQVNADEHGLELNRR